MFRYKNMHNKRVHNNDSRPTYRIQQEAQLSLTNCETLFCTVVEVLEDFCQKSRQEVHNRLQCSGTHGTDESLNRVVAVSFTVKLEVPAQVYILAILPHFRFPWGRPWGNHAKCCMDGKTIRCLQIVLQHIPIYLRQFPSYSNRKCKQEAQLSQRGRAVPRVVEYFG